MHIRRIAFFTMIFFYESKLAKDFDILKTDYIQCKTIFDN